MTTRTRLDIVDTRFNHKGYINWDVPMSLPNDQYRSDQYAENLIGSGNYRDSGCDLAPACLTCPFSVCMKEDRPFAEVRAERNAAIWKAFKRMKPANAAEGISRLMKKHDLSRRSVYRIIKMARMGKGLTYTAPNAMPEVDTHEFLTGGIFKKPVPFDPIWPQG